MPNATVIDTGERVTVAPAASPGTVTVTREDGTTHDLPATDVAID